MYRPGSPWHHGKWNNMRFSCWYLEGNIFPAVCFGSDPWPNKPPKGALINAQATPAATGAFSTRSWFLACAFFLFFFFSWCVDDAHHFRRHSSAISAPGARGCFCHRMKFCSSLGSSSLQVLHIMHAKPHTRVHLFAHVTCSHSHYTLSLMHFSRLLSKHTNRRRLLQFISPKVFCLRFSKPNNVLTCWCVWHTPLVLISPVTSSSPSSPYSTHMHNRTQRHTKVAIIIWVMFSIIESLIDLLLIKMI